MAAQKVRLVGVSFFFQLVLVTVLVDVDTLVAAEANSDVNRKADSPPNGAGDGAAAPSFSRELSRSDLVEALEKLSGGEQLGDRKAYKSTSEAMFDERRPSDDSGDAGGSSSPVAAARSVAAGGARRLGGGNDEDAAILLRRLADLVESVRDDRRSSYGQSAASDGGVAASPGAPGQARVGSPSVRLSALLARLGETHEQERRFFSNPGGRGKKQEAEPAPPAYSTERLYESVRELTGLVRDLVVTYREEKEETDKTIGFITQIIEKLVSYHVK